MTHIYRAGTGSVVSRSTIDDGFLNYAHLDQQLVSVAISRKPGADSVARILDALTGQVIGQFSVIDKVPSGPLAVLRADSELVVIGGDEGGTVVICNREGPFSNAGPHSVSDKRIQSIAAAELVGQPFAIVSDREAVQLLNLVTGQLHYLAPPGNEIDRVFIKRLSGRPVVVAGGSGNSPIYIWDLATKDSAVQPLPHRGWGVYALDMGKWRGCNVLVAGDGDGKLWVWDLDRRRVRTIETGAMILSLALVNSTKIAIGGPLGVTVLHATETFWEEARSEL
jgi:WD40 repeat protein